MSLMMVTAKVKADKVVDLEAAAGAVFGALANEQPENVRYLSLKGSDGVTFVAILEIAEGSQNPLPEMPAFQVFQSKLRDWVDGPPANDQMTVVGSYRMFDPTTAESH